MLLTALGLRDLAAQAVSPDGSAGGSLTMDATFVSQDLFRGTFLGGASIEPSIDYACGAVDLGLWTNSTVENRVQGPSSTEVELYCSYAGKVNDHVGVVPGFTYYYLPSGPGFPGNHRATLEPNVGLSGDVGRVRFTPTAYYDVVLRLLTLEMNAACTVSLARAEVDLSATAGADKSMGAPWAPKGWYNYWLVGFALPFRMGTAGRLTVGFNYTGSTQGRGGPGVPNGQAGRTESGRGLATVAYSLKL
jgi:hypothetical protein